MKWNAINISTVQIRALFGISIKTSLRLVVSSKMKR